MDLTDKKCVPCEAGGLPMTQTEIDGHIVSVPGWAEKESALHRTFTFKDFKEALAFVNTIGALAEEEGHHPDIRIVYNTVELSLSTHAVGGLSLNDFILAAKISNL